MHILSEIKPSHLVCSRFQVPEYQNIDKFRNRVVSNLIYYQTNYALSSVLLFSLITFLNPWKMFLGMSTMAICKRNENKGIIFHLFCAVFGLLYLAVERQEQVKQMKREHPTLVMMATFLSGHFLIYQV